MESRLADLLPRLNERDRRLALAAEAKSLGRGGISAVHRATGASRTTIRQGIRELSESADPDSGRVRALGGGRKKAEVLDTELPAALDSLIEPGTRGDPMSPLRWTLKSTRRIADELTAMGHAVSHTKVAALLRSSGYSLQGTRKTLEGAQHPDRDAQFRYINTLATRYLDAGDPVISVDTKKKELVGRFAQAGQEWQPSGEPVQVSTYDFPQLADAIQLDNMASTWVYRHRETPIVVLRPTNVIGPSIRNTLSKAGFKCIGGDHAPYVWVKANMDSWKFFDLILQKASVVCTPGAGDRS